MTPPRNPTRGLRALALAALIAASAAAMPCAADVVERRNGDRLKGTVVLVDAEGVEIRTESGTKRVPRREVSSISFDEPVPPLRVEIRNVRSDDAVDVLLDGEAVIRDAGEGGSWVDLTPRLKDGNNALRLRIRNDRGSWAYLLHLRVNGKVVPIACGSPHRAEDPCRCCGKTGREVGVIDDLPPIWLFVDRAGGTAEVLP